MTTQFSCSHWATDSEDVGNFVALKRQDSAASVGQAGWMNVIHYATYCSLCYAAVCLNDEVLFTDEEEMNWLRGDMV